LLSPWQTSAAAHVGTSSHHLTLLLLLLLLLQPAVRVSAVEVEAKLKTRKVRSWGCCLW
jgi:hypothetical protein